MKRPSDRLMLVVIVISFWLATIYTAPDVHNFLANGFGLDGYTQWPPRDLFEAFRVLLLAAGWLLYTAFVALAISIFALIVMTVLIPVWAVAYTYWEDRQKKKAEDQSK